jgi:predicted transglutaminase-like cysteine proteinase
MFSVTRVLIASVAMVGACAASAHAAFFSLPRMLKTHAERVAHNVPVLPPMAHTRFCLQYPADCEIRRTFRQRNIALTQARWNDLLDVNRDVNRSIVPQRNLGGVMTEEWLVSPRAGDCNDYAVTKRHQLLARGWPSRTLILSEVVTTWGEHHLVLVVRVQEGDFVLDSLAQDIRPVALARYRWVRAQSPENPKFWSTVRISTSAAAAVPVRTESRVAQLQLRYRAALALRKSDADDCCGADTDGHAEHAAVAEYDEQE